MDSISDNPSYKSPLQRLKANIFDVVDKSEQNGIVERLFDLVIILLIVLNVLAVIIEPSIQDGRFLQSLRTFENISIVVFTVEYLLRIWVADMWYPHKGKLVARLLFILSPMALVDLVAILPFYLPFLISVDLRVLRILRVFRLFRVLKINRYTTALSSLGKVVKAKADQLMSALFVIIVLMVMASVLMFNVENVVQPDKFTDVFDAMWWAVATLTTVGYGDIYPITAAGKVMSAVIAVLGIGIVAIPTGIIASGFTEQVQSKHQEQKHFCPYCGHDIKD